MSIKHQVVYNIVLKNRYLLYAKVFGSFTYLSQNSIFVNDVYVVWVNLIFKVGNFVPHGYEVN